MKTLKVNLSLEDIKTVVALTLLAASLIFFASSLHERTKNSNLISSSIEESYF